LGNGDGTFQAALTTQGLPPSAITLVAADLNGDGKPDLVLADEGDGVFVLLGNGDGTFTTPVLYNPSSFGAACVIVEDFNGDGKPDLALVPYDSGGVALLSGNGDGTFQSPLWYQVDYSSKLAFFYYAVAGDFNGDGMPDLAFATSSGGLPVFIVLLGGAGSDLTILTNPARLQFSVNGGATEIAPRALDLAPGTAAISAISPQPGPPGTQFVFTGWSDGGAASHNVIVGATESTYVASFRTQYQLNSGANPVPGGSITPASGIYYDPGTSVTLTAAPNPPYLFTSWSNGSTANPLQLTIDAPGSITANFNVPGFTCAITGDGNATVADVQQIIGEALGGLPPKDNLAHASFIGVADVQKVIEAAVGVGCLY
jgi:hypothetical protein